MVRTISPSDNASIEPGRVETQQQLLQNEPCIERFVEIGPRTILSTMAKKSAAIHSNCYPSSKWLKREFLSYHDSQSEILYQYASPPVSEPISQLPTQPFVKSTPPSFPRPLPPPLKDTLLSAVPSADISLLASHVVLAMTAQKLRRRFDQISDQKTIRDLSGGMSSSLASK
jgi:fatty acid synthase subunit alpha